MWQRDNGTKWRTHYLIILSISSKTLSGLSCIFQILSLPLQRNTPLSLLMHTSGFVFLYPLTLSVSLFIRIVLKYHFGTPQILLCILCIPFIMIVEQLTSLFRTRRYIEFLKETNNWRRKCQSGGLTCRLTLTHMPTNYSTKKKVKRE